MAQLKDDCFAFGGELMPLNDALRTLAERVRPVTGMESVALRAALGRVLAEDVTAGRDVPPLNNSAVDGYAVYFADLDPKAATRLPVVGRVAAGHPLGRAAERGEAVRVFTGAAIPMGADGTQASGPDTVFMEEDCERDGVFVILPPGLKRGSNYRVAGEDVNKGAVVLRQGHRLRAQEIGLLASLGKGALAVRKRLKAAVFSTGDEVKDPSGDAPEGCIFDANRFAVMALLENLGAEVTDLGILPDKAQTVGNVNPFQGEFRSVMAEPRLSASSALAFYGMADPSMLDTVEVAFLQGEDGPMVESRIGTGFSAHVVAGLGGFDVIDLDTPWLMARDPVAGGTTLDGPVWRVEGVTAGHGGRPA